MSYLRVYNETESTMPILETSLFDDVQAQLKAIGVRFERWDAANVTAETDPEHILAAFDADIKRLKKETGCTTADVISLTPSHPEKAAFRSKFLAEHVHSEDEIRFFVRGSGLFYLHADKKVYVIRCEKNDLISVPDGARHWFDMGPEPEFTCIRLFTNTEGWVANFTGNDIADRFPQWEHLQADRA